LAPAAAVTVPVEIFKPLFDRGNPTHWWHGPEPAKAVHGSVPLAWRRQLPAPPRSSPPVSAMMYLCYERAVTEALTHRGHDGRPRYWGRLSWPQVARLREDGTDMCLLPAGALEQHGPHLPLDTDVAIATGICLYASARTGVPVLPGLTYTNSLGHTDQWPGTISITPELLISHVRHIAAWLVKAGWRRLLLINSHYGNDAPLRCAVDHVRTEHRGALRVGLRNTWALSEEARGFYLADGVDNHANRAETSLMLALDPEAVGDYKLADDPDRTAGCVFTWTVADTSLNGVTGRPSEATREEGVSMLGRLGEDLAALVEHARGERAPILET
jgi:creatinine amidohydrolase